MENLFINFTNHPSEEWEEKQLTEAKKYGKIIDLPFPDINPNHSIDIIRSQADDYVSQIVRMKGGTKVVHIMGEMTFTYYVVNKLHQEGIQCLASTTVRDATTSEDDTKKPKFHFEQFRPYTIQNKRKKQSSSPGWMKRDYYSLSALVLVLLAEFAYLMFYHGRFVNLAIWLGLGALTLIIIIGLVGSSLNENIGIKSVKMTKLLANAVAPRWLGVLFLIFFVLHIGWLTNAIMNLFVPTGYFKDLVTSMIICMIGILVLVIFFPDGKKKKDEKPTKVFISGISSINFKNDNLRPLVRSLQIAEDDEEKCEMIILHSDYYSNPKNSSWIETNYQSFVDAYIGGLSEDDKIKYQQNIKEASDITQKLSLLIKIIAMSEFPNKKWIDNNLNIRFTKGADYNDFNNCYDILNREVQEKDDMNHELHFNLSPGTAIVAALMTLLAIDGSRKLYYYIPLDEALSGQSPKNEPEYVKRLRLKEADKTGIPLSSLLSQALDSIM